MRIVQLSPTLVAGSPVEDVREVLAGDWSLLMRCDGFRLPSLDCLQFAECCCLLLVELCVLAMKLYADGKPLQNYVEALSR